MMDSIYDIVKAFRSAAQETLTLLEAYEGFDGERDILQEDYIPKPQKNLFRKGYSEPTFSVRKCARSKLRKKTGRLSRESVV